MAEINLSQLKSDVETAVNALESVLNLVDDLPLPAGVGATLSTVQKVLADVQKFLAA
jgi:hypothetical protein